MMKPGSHHTLCAHTTMILIDPLYPPSAMEEEAKEEEEEEEEEEYYKYQLVPKADWFEKVISFQADIIYNCILTLLSPFIALFSVLYESYCRAEEAVAAMESAVLRFPYKLTYGSTVLLRKLGMGVVAAVHVFMVLTMVMLLALVLGVSLVRFVAEEPVFLREKLFFDYADVNPKAVFYFGRSDDGVFKKSHMRRGVPIGHTFHVSLVLLMPESDDNRQVGVFQLTAELLSISGNVTTKTTQPCMLRFRSLPIRLARTFLMSIPLVLGFSEETQKISVEIIKHKEGYQRTKAIRVTLIPRAGTSFLPQLYEAEMLMNSKLPWTKELIHNWKWTLCVWASINIYIMLLLLIICCCRPLVFPSTTIEISTNDHFETDMASKGLKETDMASKESKETTIVTRDDREISELVRKWQERRRKRKTIALQGDVAEAVGSPASSSITREDPSGVTEEEIADSESVCLGG